MMRSIQLVAAYIRLFGQYIFTVRPYDVMIIGYIGHLDIPLAWLLTRFPRRPLAFCPLISLYDTLADDRAAFSKQSVMGGFLKWLDGWTCRRADVIVLDTDAHIEYFVKTFSLPRASFVRVFVGADERVFTPRVRTRQDGVFHVTFVGKFTPLHGIQTVIQAAHLLNGEPDIVFTCVGSGQLSDEIHNLSESLALTHVRFIDWMEYDQLPDLLAESDVCLGIFGITDKAGRVIPGKVYHALAMGIPVITGDSPAIHELLDDGESAMLCARGDADALSRAILRLKTDDALRTRIATNGHRVYQGRASEEQIGCTVAAALARTVAGESPR